MKEEIEKFFKGEVDDSPETILKYSRDASLLSVAPEIVCFPYDSEDVENLVRWVAAHKEEHPNLSITARCAGTDMSGAAIGESIILDFTRHMNRLVSFNPPYITVEPGMFYRDFEKITLGQNLILPCYTASKSLNAMGGMYGNNSAGERTLKYGKTEDYVEEAQVVFSNGERYTVGAMPKHDLNKKAKEHTYEGNVYRKICELLTKHKTEIKNAKPQVSKNSAGYYLWNAESDGKFDLNKILVGSQGTLGIATEITFRLVKNEKYSKLVVVFIRDLEPIGRLVDEILQEKPETLEAYDDKTMRLAVKFFPDFLKNKGWLGMIRFMWGFLPEFFMLLSGGFPKMILLVEFSGENDLLVNEKCKKLAERIKNFHLKTHITKSEVESEKYWDIRRESFSLLRKHVNKKHTAPFIDDIIVRPEFLPKFIPELNKILGKYKLTYTIAGHAGDGNFHIIPLMDFSRADTAKIIMDLSEQVYDLVARFHGSITAEHNDGLIRTPFLSKMYSPEILTLFKETKQIFDPQNIFNPGKKVIAESGAGSKDYLVSHVAMEHTASHRV